MTMHKWRVTVDMTYTTEVLTPEQHPLAGQESAIDVEDPDYHRPYIEACVYLGETDPDEEEA